MDNRELLVDRITERIRTTPLHYSVAGNTRPTLPDDPHDEHDYLWDCLVCRAKDMPGALRMLVAEIVAQALGDA